MKENRPELALLRGKRDEQALRLWVEYLGDGDESLARRYAMAVAAFLGEPPSEGAADWERYVGKLSPRTRENYSFAVTEFFEWLAHRHGRVVPPHRVMRTDAEAYANWLATRPFSLEAEKLRDGDEPVRLAIYGAVEKLGSTDWRSIGTQLPSWVIEERGKPAEWLRHELGRMVLHDLLIRTPTLEQVRKDHPRAGIDLFVIPLPPATPGGPARSIPLDDLFLYTVPPPKPVKRATILLRLNALSAFWDALSQGENVPGGEAILQHNIFKGLKKRVGRGIRKERARATVSQRLDPSLVPTLLDTAARGRSLTELRDRAMLYFLVFTGTRVSEMTQLRAGKPLAAEELRWPGWFDGSVEPASVVVRRKGDVMMALPYPPVALGALQEFRSELARRAAPDSAQHVDPKAPHYIDPTSTRWRYRDLALMPDAPLFPPLQFWGANSAVNYQAQKPNTSSDKPTPYTRGMTRHGVTKLLRRLAQRAGLTPSQVKQIHPHALRHFAATAMVGGGKDLREVQSILGHDSVTTTEGYIEQPQGIVQLSGQAQILEYLQRLTAAAAAPGEPPMAPERADRPEAEVIETYAVPGPEAPEKPPERAPTPPSRALAVAEAQPPTDLQEAAMMQASEPAQDFAEALGGEAVPTHMLPAAPENLEPTVEAVATPEGEAIREDNRLVAIEGDAVAHDPSVFTEVRAGKSPGSPEWVYEALEDGKDREQIEFTILKRRGPKDKRLVTLEEQKQKTGSVTEYVQTDSPRHHFLAKNYDPWPANYGIGTSSLLCWFAKGSASADGTVKATDPVTNKSVVVPPIPVLAPEQVFGETSGYTVLERIEDLYKAWLHGDAARNIAPSPMRTYGLVRWYAFFAYTTSKLQKYLTLKGAEDRRAVVPKWVPWTDVAEVGRDVRAHKDEWASAWFQENAHTYVTAVRFYKTMVPRGRAERASDKEFFEHFEAATMEAIAFTEELPPWMAAEDPVRDIYDEDPEEWERFAHWIASVTGQQLSKLREQSREDAAEYAADAYEHRVDAARELLRWYYDEIVDRLLWVSRYLKGTAGIAPESPIAAEYADMSKRELAEEQKRLQEEKRLWIERLTELGVGDPQDVLKGAEGVEEPRKRERRIATIIEKTIGQEKPDLADPNMFGRSQLFDPGFFSIDYKAKTIVHDDDYRRLFAERFGGRDSELLMRRSARAMWEYVKRSNIEGKEPTASQYSMLYATMLSYISWIVPSPAEMEDQVQARGPFEETGLAVRGDAARKEWLRSQATAMRALVYGQIAAAAPSEEIARGAVERGAAPEQAERIAQIVESFEKARGATDEERVVAVATAMSMSVDEVQTALRMADLIDAHQAQIMEWEVDDTAMRQLGASIGPDGHMRVFRDPRDLDRERRRERQEAEEQASVVREGERVLRPGIIARMRDTAKKLLPNASTSSMFEFVAGEPAPKVWYVLDRAGWPDYRGNPGPTAYVSPGAMARKSALVANARRVLPSPFRMIAAMTLEEAPGA